MKSVEMNLGQLFEDSICCGFVLWVLFVVVVLPQPDIKKIIADKKMVNDTL